jgi:hypothetical protein
LIIKANWLLLTLLAAIAELWPGDQRVEIAS